MEATRIADFIAWPSHDDNDRIDFGNSNVGVITTHFNDILENSNVKINDTLTDKVKVIFFMEGKLKQANINMNHLLLIIFSFIVYLYIRSTYNQVNPGSLPVD